MFSIFTRTFSVVWKSDNSSMPSESYRRRRNRRHRGRRTDAGKPAAQEESTNDPQFEAEAPELLGTNSVAAKGNATTAKNSNSTKTPSAGTSAPSYAERVKLGKHSNWRNLGRGPCSSQASRLLFLEREKKPPVTLLDFQNPPTSTKTTLYIPPPLRNRQSSDFMSFIEPPEIVEVKDVPPPEPVEAAVAEDFMDSELQAFYQDSIDNIGNYDWNFCPLTNYTGADNWEPFKSDRLPLALFGKTPSPPLDGAGTSSPGPLASQLDFLKFGWKVKTEEVPESGRAQERDKDGNWNWGDLMMSAPLPEQEITGSPSPGMYVYPMRIVNFVGNHIQFGVTAFNIPQGFRVTSKLFEAVAESPSGVTLPCFIKNDMDKTRPPWSPRMVEYFQGHFKATGEIGLYKLQVRLSLPLTKCYQSFGVLGDESTILVSRNYYRESLKQTTSLYTLNFDPKKLVSQASSGSSTMTANNWGLACDKNTNNLYYTERLGNKVICMDPEYGRTLFHFDQSRHTFNRPTGIACDESHRRVLVCDKDNHTICYYTMNGQFIGTVGGQGFENGMFCYPWDVDVSPLGTHFAVTDSRNKRIQLFDHYGNYIDKFSVFETNPFIYKNFFDYPRGIAFGHDGQFIYTTDFNTQNILEIPLSMARFQRIAPEGQLHRPQGLVVDEIGCILVADTRNNCVRHMAFDGTHLSTIRFVGGGALEYPVNLAMMQSGQIAVMDLYGRIRCF